MRAPYLSLLVLLTAGTACAQEVAPPSPIRNSLMVPPVGDVTAGSNGSSDAPTELVDEASGSMPRIASPLLSARISLSPLGRVPSIHGAVQELGRDSSKPIHREVIGAWTITGFVFDGSSKLQCAVETRADNGGSFAYSVEATRGDPEFHMAVLVSSPAPEGVKATMVLKVDNSLQIQLDGEVKDGALELRPALDERSKLHNIFRKGNWLLLVRQGAPDAIRVSLRGSAEALRSLAECTNLGLSILKK